MLFNVASFIGIDPTAGVRPFTYAALDAELGLLALGEGSMDDVLAFVGGQRSAGVAVCAPARPNRGVMERAEVRTNLSPPPRPGRWTDLRLAEYLLRQHNITIPRTPAEESACPAWMRMGFTLVRRLGEMDYHPYPQAEAARQWLEVYPHASFTILLGRQPFPKNTLEGRLQRQLILFQREMAIPDPMRFFEEITRHRLLQGILPLGDLYSAAELDALVAAFTVWLAVCHPEQVCALGDAEEGQIYLPIAELRDRY